MSCGDGKTPLCFPILSAWIVDHAENATLYGIGSRLCLRSKVPCKELGENLPQMYEVCDYTQYGEKALEHGPEEEATIAEYFQ